MQRFEQNNLKYLGVFFKLLWGFIILKFFYYPKSILGFSKMDKKMSKNEKGRKTFEKSSFVTEMHF
jgi:hypothetical protein